MWTAVDGMFSSTNTGLMNDDQLNIKIGGVLLLFRVWPLTWQPGFESRVNVFGVEWVLLSRSAGGLVGPVRIDPNTPCVDQKKIN